MVLEGEEIMKEFFMGVLETLKTWFTKNWGLKGIALAAAFIIWIIVKGVSGV